MEDKTRISYLMALKELSYLNPTQADVANRLNLNKATVSEAFSLLEKENYVQKIVYGARNIYNITDNGWSIILRISRIKDEIYSMYADRFGMSAEISKEFAENVCQLASDRFVNDLISIREEKYRTAAPEIKLKNGSYTVPMTIETLGDHTTNGIAAICTRDFEPSAYLSVEDDAVLILVKPRNVYRVSVAGETVEGKIKNVFVPDSDYQWSPVHKKQRKWAIPLENVFYAVDDNGGLKYGKVLIKLIADNEKIPVSYVEISFDFLNPKKNK